MYRGGDAGIGAFAARGIRHGSVIALLLPSTPFYLIAYLAAARLGAVTAGINARYRRTDIGHILRRSGAALLAAVDAVTFFDEDTPRELIAAVLPDILIKGADENMHIERCKPSFQIAPFLQQLGAFRIRGIISGALPILL